MLHALVYYRTAYERFVNVLHTANIRISVCATIIDIIFNEMECRETKLTYNTILKA